MDVHLKTRLDQLAAPRRNRYFYGKLLDELHLRMEQEYFNGKRWTLNRLALGRGALCGLTVTADGKTVWVSSGAAIDGLGREIVVPSKVEIDPSKIAAQCGTVRDRDPTSETEVYLTLCYEECKADFEPVLVTDCQPQEQCAASTTVEGYIIEVHVGVPPAVNTGDALCQELGRGADKAAKRKAVNELLAHSPCAPDPNPCPVLASVKFNADGTVVVDLSAREQVYSNDVLFDLVLCLQEGTGSGLEPGLTHITSTSWLHAHAHAHTGTDSPLVPVTLIFTPDDGGDPTTETKDALVIGFSGEIKLLPYANPFDMAACFEVAVLDLLSSVPEMARTLLPALVTPLTTVAVDANGSRAVSAQLTVGSSGPAGPIMGLACLLTSAQQDAIRKALQVFVRLRGDFILDARGNAVDGEFARGQFPTGDGPPGAGAGLQGGTFESWFTCRAEIPTWTNSSVALNAASAADLAGVPGINLYTAMAIVAARQKQRNRKFRKLEDLVGVGGLSAESLNDIRPNLTL